MNIPRPSLGAFALLVCGLLIGACTAAGGPGWTFAPLGPTPAPATPAAPTPGDMTPAPGNLFELEMNAQLQILQDGQQVTELHVSDGETYTFRVNNSAGFTHDFFVGPPDRLEAGDTAGLDGLDEWESGVREFSWTANRAEADGWQFACTVAGHYTFMHGQLIFDE
ncbi:MAG TPA: hypothetical protein VNW68_07415 [Candidatus Limnocylindria bacterium]|nr:hypothetical protein [Candidatus Limnocylindria bacterium]